MFRVVLLKKQRVETGTGRNKNVKSSIIETIIINIVYRRKEF